MTHVGDGHSLVAAEFCFSNFRESFGSYGFLVHSRILQEEATKRHKKHKTSILQLASSFLFVLLVPLGGLLYHHSRNILIAH